MRGDPARNDARAARCADKGGGGEFRDTGGTPHQNCVSPRAPQGHSARPPLAHGPWPSGTPVIASAAALTRPQWSAACRLMRITARRAAPPSWARKPYLGLVYVHSRPRHFARSCQRPVCMRYNCALGAAPPRATRVTLGASESPFFSTYGNFNTARATGEVHACRKH